MALGSAIAYNFVDLAFLGDPIEDMSMRIQAKGQAFPKTMKAVVTIGQGGFEQLQYKDILMPSIRPGEVLIKVLAAGINNTDINTRIGWYSNSLKASTHNLTQSQSRGEKKYLEDGGWNNPTPFPLIQGTDCCGLVVAVGQTKHQALVGKRVIVRPCQRTKGFESYEQSWMASDFDGAFAEYTKVPASEVFPVTSNWSDEELASIPCAYGTAENMLIRSKLKKAMRVLVCGASGGVGSATIQLAKLRSAEVLAVTNATKAEAVRSIGADKIIDRELPLDSQIEEESIDLVLDNVGGQNFPFLLKALKRGETYISSGAIAGPQVGLDLRDLYLKDLQLLGSTAWDAQVFPNLVKYIEENQIRPCIAKVFSLKDIVNAQEEFLKKNHIGKIVLKI